MDQRSKVSFKEYLLTIFWPIDVVHDLLYITEGLRKHEYMDDMLRNNAIARVILKIFICVVFFLLGHAYVILWPFWIKMVILFVLAVVGSWLTWPGKFRANGVTEYLFMYVREACLGFLIGMFV